MLFMTGNTVDPVKHWFDPWMPWPHVKGRTQPRWQEQQGNTNRILKWIYRGRKPGQRYRYRYRWWWPYARYTLTCYCLDPVSSDIPWVLSVDNMTSVYSFFLTSSYAMHYKMITPYQSQFWILTFKILNDINCNYGYVFSFIFTFWMITDDCHTMSFWKLTFRNRIYTCLQLILKSFFFKNISLSHFLFNPNFCRRLFILIICSLVYSRLAD